MVSRNTDFKSLTRTFGAHVSGFGAMDLNSQPQANQPVFVTDLAPNKSFDMPAVTAVSTQSAEGIAVNGPDLSATKRNVQTTMSDYAKTDQLIKSTIGDFAKHVLGPEQGAQLMGQLAPTQGSSMQQAIMSLADPSGTGVLSTLLTVRSAVTAEAGRIKNPEVLAQLDKVLAAIQEASDPNKTPQADAPKIPQGIDFSAIQTAKQMEKFLSRDVAQDPVMLAGQSTLDAIAKIENNQEITEERGHEKVTAAKVAQAVTAGDGEALTDMLDTPKAEAIKAAPISLAAVETFGQLPAAQVRAFTGLDPKLSSIGLVHESLASRKNPDTELSLEAVLRSAAPAQPSSGMMG